MSVRASNRIDKFVGTRLRLRRLILGMSQTELGEAVGLTFQQIQKYEKGANRIGAGRLQELAHVMGVPVAFFFEGAPDDRSRNDNNVASLADPISKLLNDSRRHSAF